jgi:hypothetical protein
MVRISREGKDTKTLILLLIIMAIDNEGMPFKIQFLFKFILRFFGWILISFKMHSLDNKVKFGINLGKIRDFLNYGDLCIAL